MRQFCRKKKIDCGDENVFHICLYCLTLIHRDLPTHLTRSGLQVHSTLLSEFADSNSGVKHLF